MGFKVVKEGRARLKAGSKVFKARVALGFKIFKAGRALDFKVVKAGRASQTAATSKAAVVAAVGEAATTHGAEHKRRRPRLLNSRGGSNRCHWCLLHRLLHRLHAIRCMARRF